MLAACSAVLAPSLVFFTLTLPPTANGRFSAAEAPINSWTLRKLLPVRFFHPLPRILWVTAF